MHPLKTIDFATRKCLVAIVSAYQRFVSPLFRPQCRFHPTCSNYAIEALQKKTTVAGVGLVFIRIMKCNPLFKGGNDPLK